MGASRANLTGRKIRIVYVTSSEFKKDENGVFVESCQVNGTPVKDLFHFEIRKEPIQEMLEVDLNVMVREEVKRAYNQIQVPCIVEHAGLIFEDYGDRWFPGGLTKPMWNVLQDKFLKETNSAERRTIARAVVGYCDGKRTLTFEGETLGKLARRPRGNRKFYWDTVFIPNELSGKSGKKTYAEICDSFGIAHKLINYSQSAKAMIKFLEFMLENPRPGLWNI